MHKYKHSRQPARVLETNIAWVKGPVQSQEWPSSGYCVGSCGHQRGGESLFCFLPLLQPDAQVPWGPSLLIFWRGFLGPTDTSPGASTAREVISGRPHAVSLSFLLVFWHLSDRRVIIKCLMRAVYNAGLEKGEGQQLTGDIARARKPRTAHRIYLEEGFDSQDARA